MKLFKSHKKVHYACHLHQHVLVSRSQACTMGTYLWVVGTVPQLDLYLVFLSLLLCRQSEPVKTHFLLGKCYPRVKTTEQGAGRGKWNLRSQRSLIAQKYCRWIQERQDRRQSNTLETHGIICQVLSCVGIFLNHVVLPMQRKFIFLQKTEY